MTSVFFGEIFFVNASRWVWCHAYELCRRERWEWIPRQVSYRVPTFSILRYWPPWDVRRQDDGGAHFADTQFPTSVVLESFFLLDFVRSRRPQEFLLSNTFFRPGWVERR